MIFQAFDFALLFAGFKTGGTKVLAAQLTIALGAKKSAAGRANNRGLFLRMVKAARFAIHHNWLAGFAGGERTKQRRKNFDLKRCAAGRARLEGRLVEQSVREQRLAFGASNGSRTHAAGYLHTTRVLQMQSCNARFWSSKPAMM